MTPLINSFSAATTGLYETTVATHILDSFSVQRSDIHTEQGDIRVMGNFSAQVTEIHTEQGRAKIVEQFSIAPSGSDIMGVSTPEYEPANNDILRYHGNG